MYFAIFFIVVKSRSYLNMKKKQKNNNFLQRTLSKNNSIHCSICWININEFPYWHTQTFLNTIDYQLSRPLERATLSEHILSIEKTICNNTNNDLHLHKPLACVPAANSWNYVTLRYYIIETRANCRSIFPQHANGDKAMATAATFHPRNTTGSFRFSRSRRLVDDGGWTVISDAVMMMVKWSAKSGPDLLLGETICNLIFFLTFNCEGGFTMF